MASAAHFALCILVNYYTARAVVELEQAGVLYACPGGPMSVTCSTSADFLLWNVTLLYNDSFHNKRTFVRQLSKLGIIRMEEPITTTSTTINVSRLLNESSPLPLISTIYIRNTTADLNGTVITCSEEMMALYDTIEIILIGNNSGSIITPKVHVSDQFGVSSVSITLEWTHKNGVSYSISVDPQVAVNYTGRNSAQVIVSYNTKYNFSVIASLCGINVTNFIIINHVTCPPLDSINSNRHPDLVGSVAAIKCPLGMILTGPNVTTCMENRQWYPDPKSNMMCKANCETPIVGNNISLNYTSTLEDSLLTFQCEDGLLPDDVFTARCYRNESWIPNPSSHVCTTSSAVNCGHPSPPSDGYLEAYTSTLEGAKVNRVHVCQNDQQSQMEQTVCNSDGQWKMINGSKCSAMPAVGSNYLIISLGCSFGVLLMLLMAIVIVAAVPIAKMKGLCQRNIICTPASGIDGGGMIRADIQGECRLLHYSRANKQLNDIEEQNNPMSMYSLLQPYPSEKDDNEQTNSNDIRCQPTALIYTDVIPFQQKTQVFSFDPADKIEYAQLKDHSNEISTQLTTSLQTRHPAGIDHEINLDNLLIQLKPAVLDSDTWYQLGKALGTKKELLDKCTQLQPDQSLVEILDDWLRNHSGQPSWNEIADALIEIGLQQLALNIKSVYETGKLPIEVDMNTVDRLPHSRLCRESETVIPPLIPPRGT